MDSRSHSRWEADRNQYSDMDCRRESAEIMDELGVEQASMGRARVEPSLQLPGHPRAFIIGDAAYLVNGNGQPLPCYPLSHPAGKNYCKKHQTLINRQEPAPFYYKDPGLLATIGRNAAVARIWGVSFSDSSPGSSGSACTSIASLDFAIVLL